MTPETHAPSRLAALERLLSAATREASHALAVWTAGEIAVELDGVSELGLEEALQALDFAAEPQVNVVLTIDGDFGGVMILAFDQENARRLAAALAGARLSPGEPWSVLARSALEETGNILCCAYINALARVLDRRLTPSPPYFLEDFGACVIQQALMDQAGCDRVLIGRTVFQRQGQQLSWSVYFLPHPDLRRSLEEALHRSPSRCEDLEPK